MSIEAETVVNDLCKVGAGLNINEIMQFFTDEAVVHFVPMKPEIGKEESRKTIEGVLKGVTWAEYKVLHSASNDNIVFNERIDSFEAGGKRVSIPVIGIFEITSNGKIKAWRDYFDMEMFTAQMK